MHDELPLPETPFTLEMAKKAGWSGRKVRQAVQDGQVRRVLHGAYVTAGAPDTIELRVAAVKLRVRPDSVVCDRTAAWLLGVDVFAYHEKEILPPVETCVPRFKQPTRRHGHDGHSRDLSENDVITLHGVAVTTPLRTALDLGCLLPPRDALAMLDAFMRLHGLTTAQLITEARRYYRRRGVRSLRPLIPLADPRAESMAESWVRKDLIDAGLRPKELQWWVHHAGVPTYRLDMAWPKHRVAVEYDGQEFHDSDDEDLRRQQREHDEERREWLRDRGWVVVVVTKDRLDATSKAIWIREVREAIAARTFRRCRTARAAS